MRAMAIDSRDYAFIDYGCGKGRALLLAAEYGFSTIIGIELAPKLARIAERNVAEFRLRRPNSGSIKVRCMDATEFELPEGNECVFLYNPFGEAVLREVLSNVERLYPARAGELVIAYRNPVHAKVRC